MLRALIAVILVGCGASKPPAPREPIDDVLPCVITRVADQIRGSRSPRDELQLAVDIALLPTTRAVATRYLVTLTEQLPKDLDVSGPLVLARAAHGLVEIGAYDEAAKLAERALASLDGASADDRGEVLLIGALVLPLAGKEPPQVVLEGNDSIAKLYAVQGLARNGRKDQAKRLLASLASLDSRDLKGAHIFALVAVGEIETARAVVAKAPEPILYVWLAKALVEAKHPDARRILDEDIGTTSVLATGAATPDEIIAAGAMWSELVRYREMLDRDTARAARTRLHDWLLAKEDQRRELIGINVVRAKLAEHDAEAARLDKAMQTPLSSMVRLELAVMRGDFATALDQLTEHQQERGALRKLAAVDAPLLDALGTAELTVWVVLAAKPSAEPAIVERFRGLACQPANAGKK